MFKIKSLSAVLAMVVLAGCGDSGKKSNNGINVDKFTGLRNLERYEKVVYQTDCYVQKVEGQTNYQMSQIEITMNSDNNADFSLKSALFTKDCEMALVETEIEGNGDFSQSNKLFEVDLHELMMRPLLDEVTDAFNEDATCGITNWVTFQSTSIMDTDCFEGSSSGDVYLNARNNGAALTVYMCDDGQPLSKECDVLNLKKM